MRGRVRFLLITLANAPGWSSLIPRVVVPGILIGWLVGCLVLPGPQGRFEQWLSVLAAGAGLTVFAGHFLKDLPARQDSRRRARLEHEFEQSHVEELKLLADTK